jgi:hypothetical protein
MRVLGKCLGKKSRNHMGRSMARSVAALPLHEPNAWPPSPVIAITLVVLESAVAKVVSVRSSQTRYFGSTCSLRKQLLTCLNISVRMRPRIRSPTQATSTIKGVNSKANTVLKVIVLTLRLLVSSDNLVASNRRSVCR